MVLTMIKTIEDYLWIVNDEVVRSHTLSIKEQNLKSFILILPQLLECVKPYCYVFQILAIDEKGKTLLF